MGVISWTKRLNNLISIIQSNMWTNYSFAGMFVNGIFEAIVQIIDKLPVN